MKSFILFFFCGIIVLLFSCSGNNENKNPLVYPVVQTKRNSNPVQKSTPHYKLGFEIQLGEYAYNYFFDSISNSISTITDSVDAVQLIEDETRAAEGDTNFVWGEHETFTGYYLKKYCLVNDTFTLCKDSILKKYHQPLIITRKPLMSLEYTNSVEHITEFPFWFYDDTLNFHVYNQTTEALWTAENLSGEKIDKVFEDEFLDLDGDSVNERVMIYFNSSVNIIIAYQENGDWKLKQKIETEYVNPMQFLISTIKFSNAKEKALIFRGFYPGNYFTNRNVEWMQIYLPNK